MFERSVKIKNESGLHARPASDFVKFVKKYSNDITLVAEENKINPRSIIEILTAGLNKGSEVKVQVEGDNAEVVCNEIVKFISELED